MNPATLGNKPTATEHIIEGGKETLGGLVVDRRKELNVYDPVALRVFLDRTKRNEINPKDYRMVEPANLRTLKKEPHKPEWVALMSILGPLHKELAEFMRVFQTQGKVPKFMTKRQEKLDRKRRNTAEGRRWRN